VEDDAPNITNFSPWLFWQGAVNKNGGTGGPGGDDRYSHLLRGLRSDYRPAAESVVDASLLVPERSEPAEVLAENRFC